MGYQPWSVVAFEQPTAAKWNILGTNDAGFFDGTGIDDDVILPRHISAGMVAQVVTATYNEAATGTTTMPSDDTIPQNTEGNEYMSISITPKSATNILVIEVSAHLGSSIANNIVGAIFKDAETDARSARAQRCDTATGPYNLFMRFTMVAGSTSAMTFDFRAGGAAAGTTTFNGDGGNRRFGDIPKSSIMITEYKA